LDTKECVLIGNSAKWVSRVLSLLATKWKQLTENEKIMVPFDMKNLLTTWLLQL